MEEIQDDCQSPSDWGSMQDLTSLSINDQCPATAPKPERSGEDLYGGVGQNPCCSVCKPGQELQETSDLCNCKHRFLYQILSSIFLLYQILISRNKMEINYLKIIQCDFLDIYFLDSVSHS